MIWETVLAGLILVVATPIVLVVLREIIGWVSALPFLVAHFANRLVSAEVRDLRAAAYQIDNQLDLILETERSRPITAFVKAMRLAACYLFNVCKIGFAEQDRAGRPVLNNARLTATAVLTVAAIVIQFMAPSTLPTSPVWI